MVGVEEEHVVGADELAEVVRVVKRLGEHISLMPDGPAKKLKTDAIRDCVIAKYPRAHHDVVIKLLPTHS